MVHGRFAAAASSCPTPVQLEASESAPRPLLLCPFVVGLKGGGGAIIHSGVTCWEQHVCSYRWRLRPNDTVTPCALLLYPSCPTGGLSLFRLWRPELCAQSPYVIKSSRVTATANGPSKLGGREQLYAATWLGRRRVTETYRRRGGFTAVLSPSMGITRGGFLRGIFLQSSYTYTYNTRLSYNKSKSPPTVQRTRPFKICTILRLLYCQQSSAWHKVTL